MIDQLTIAICKTVIQFQEHPLDFLSESDIQALLFVELRNETREIRYLYDAEGANHPRGTVLQGQAHRLRFRGGAGEIRALCG